MKILEGSMNCTCSFIFTKVKDGDCLTLLHFPLQVMINDTIKQRLANLTRIKNNFVKVKIRLEGEVMEQQTEVPLVTLDQVH